jgi:uncharacterized protein YigE (DUF2233 family)
VTAVPLLLALLACTSSEAPEPARHAATPVSPSKPEPPPADGVLHTGEVELVRDLGSIRVEAQPWRLDDEVGTAWRVRLPRDARMDVAHADAVTPFDALVPDDAGPFVAVNGGFYDEHGKPMGLVVAEGKVVHKLGRSGSGVLEHGPHRLRVVHRDDWKPGARAALQSIDRLVEDGKPLVAPQETARRAARTAVALTDDAVWVVLAVADDSIETTPDGAISLHATAFRGLPLWAFARYLVDAVKADQALNLDGAVSTQIEVRTPEATWAVRGENGTVQAVVLRP